MKFSLIFLLLTTVLSACALFGVQPFSRYDDRRISIMTVNYFDQRQPLADGLPSWRGDWLLRRERLELVDRALRASRPDLIIGQDMIAKRGSPTDSDRNILARGALFGYEWASQRARHYDDTQEISHHSIAASLPIRVDRAYSPVMLPFGNTGLVSFYRLELDHEPILVVNTEMPSRSVQVDSWYPILMDMIERYKKEFDVCSERVVVAGYLPGHPSWPGYERILGQLQLKDTSVGFCELAADCLTADPKNHLFLASSGSDSGGRVDRILVHKSALVLSSQRVMTDASETSEHGTRYHLAKLWPTRRFGWLSSVRLAKCL